MIACASSARQTCSRIVLRSLLTAAVVVGCGFGLGATSSSSAVAQPYPSKKIQIIVPFTPGGANDVLARVIAQKLTEAWGQPVIVENKPGAAGNLGADLVAKSAPDGYTVLIVANNILAANPALYDKMPFDALKDFAPISMLGTVPILLVANPSVPVKSVADLAALAKQKPGAVIYGSAGNGSPQHLSAELFASLAGVKLQHVPYRGSGPLVTDLLSGQLNIGFVPINSVVQLVQTGKLNALGVATTQRLPYLKDVPTISEAGIAGYQSDIWIALVAPAGTPQDIVVKLNGAMKDIMQMPDVREKLAAQGIDPKISTPDELAKQTKIDFDRWGALIRAAGIRP